MKNTQPKWMAEFNESINNAETEEEKARLMIIFEDIINEMSEGYGE